MNGDERTDEDAPKATGTGTGDIETTVGERPQVNGVDPALAEKDPQDITMADLAGLSDDERDEVLSAMSGSDGAAVDATETPETPTGQSQPSGDTPTDDGGHTEAGDTERTDDEGAETYHEDAPEPATLDEMGLLDENGDFPWEGESLGETAVGEGGVIERFKYKKTNFEVREPDDRERFERQFDSLAEVQEMDDRAKRRSTADRYSRKVAEQCLTVEGHPVVSVYRVSHNGTHYVVPDPDGSKGLAQRDGAIELWDAMTWFDRFKIGMRIGEDVLGERQFRPRVD